MVGTYIYNTIRTQKRTKVFGGFSGVVIYDSQLLVQFSTVNYNFLEPEQYLSTKSDLRYIFGPLAAMILCQTSEFLLKFSSLLFFPPPRSFLPRLSSDSTRTRDYLQSFLLFSLKEKKNNYSP